MSRTISFAEASTAVRTRRDLLESGMTSRGIVDAVAAGTHRRIQRNRYVSAELWDQPAEAQPALAV